MQAQEFILVFETISDDLKKDIAFVVNKSVLEFMQAHNFKPVEVAMLFYYLGNINFWEFIHKKSRFPTVPKVIFFSMFKKCFPNSHPLCGGILDCNI